MEFKWTICVHYICLSVIELCISIACAEWQTEYPFTLIIVMVSENEHIS